MKTTTSTLFPILLILILGSCCTTTPKGQNSEATPHHTWKLKSMEGEAFSGKEAENTPKLAIDFTEKKFYGDDGCNKIWGVVQTSSEGDFAFGDIASTRMACEDMKTPNRYTALLKKVRQYEITATTLLLKDEANNNILTYSKVAK